MWAHPRGQAWFVLWIKKLFDDDFSVILHELAVHMWRQMSLEGLQKVKLATSW